jgi:nucleotide-binding universal stress UspA family protein
MPNKPFVVVVGTDYSPQASRALRVAFEQASRAAPAELHVVHVALATSPGPDVALGLPSVGFGSLPVLSLEEQQALLVKYLDAELGSLLSVQDRKVRIVAHVVLNAPAFGLTHMATQLQADLLVVGSHGRNVLLRWLLGSVAESVLRQATCAILVVPPEPHELNAPAIEPPCPRCVVERAASQGQQMWCSQHRERHDRRHTYHQSDRVSADTNFPLVVR